VANTAPTFSVGTGLITTPFLSHFVVVQDDGKIVALGTANFGPFGHTAALVRFNPDGTVDAPRTAATASRVPAEARVRQPSTWHPTDPSSSARTLLPDDSGPNQCAQSA